MGFRKRFRRFRKKSGKGRGAFCAEPDSGEDLGGFAAEPGQVQQGLETVREKGREALTEGAVDAATKGAPGVDRLSRWEISFPLPWRRTSSGGWAPPRAVGKSSHEGAPEVSRRHSGRRRREQRLVKIQNDGVYQPKSRDQTNPKPDRHPKPKGAHHPGDQSRSPALWPSGRVGGKP